jgi:RimJ/RimL family protein N-acetyltransferase
VPGYEALIEDVVPSLTQRIQAPEYRAWVKCEGDELIGVSSAHLIAVDEGETPLPPQSLVHVHIVAVQLNYQGQGHGAELFDSALATMGHLYGPINAVWTVHEQNERSRKLSESFGGEPIDIGRYAEDSYLAYMVELQGSGRAAD